MPLQRGGRPLKRWRYVGVYGSELMVCAGVVQIGVARQEFWAVWDRAGGRLHERTHLWPRGRVRFEPGRVRVHDGDVRIDLALTEDGGVETVSPHGAQHIWTRKQGGVPASGTVTLGATEHRLDALAVIDESAGYHARHTAWRWSAGVGMAADGRRVAWNLVDGVHDAPGASERSLWIDGEPRQVGPVGFASDLSAVFFGEGGALHFAAEATRARRDALLVLHSDYVQPFGTFTGSLPGVGDLREGFGVMERHVARW